MDDSAREVQPERRARIKAWFFRKRAELELCRRLTVMDLAQHCGVTRRTIANWVNRGTAPEGEHLLRVAVGLGDDIYEVLGQLHRDAALSRLPGRYYALPPAQRTQLVAVAEKLNAESQGDCSDPGR